MAEPFLGQIQPFGFNFAPRGWALCEGQLLPISQNTALFSLLGTTYGGDGRTTFGLPDLRGRSMINAGQGPGLSSVRLGQKGGSEGFTLQVANLPSHGHSVTATLHGESAQANSQNPANKMLAGPAASIYAEPVPANNLAMSAESIVVTQQNVGGNQEVQKRSPYLAVTVCIALQGIFPSRN